MILTRALTGLVAAGAAIAGMMLWRIDGIRRGRWIVAGLATYGAAAFVHAMVSGIALGAALAGHGLFPRLPYVLQGAFIGGFVILPLGWIATILPAGFPRFRKGWLRRNMYQAVALTTCLAVVFTAMPAGTAWGPRSRSHPRSARRAALDMSLHAIEDGERDAPRDRWDP